MSDGNSRMLTGQVMPMRIRQTSERVWEDKMLVEDSRDNFSIIKAWLTRPDVNYPTANSFLKVQKGVIRIFFKATPSQMREIAEQLNSWADKVEELKIAIRPEETLMSTKADEIAHQSMEVRKQTQPELSQLARVKKAMDILQGADDELPQEEDL